MKGSVLEGAFGISDNSELPLRASNKIRCSDGFVEFLEEQAISLVCSSYQSGRLYFLGRDGSGGLGVSFVAQPQATGLALQGESISLATLSHLVRFENVVGQGDGLRMPGVDRAYVVRSAHTTGNLHVHQIAIAGDGSTVLVNTMYNCLATLSNVHSFRVLWIPPFISEIVREDRCHLNGVAMKDGEPAFVTAFAATDAPFGYRGLKGSGGVLVDVRSNAIVSAELSMPHSPRIHDGRLWITNSGTGELGLIDLASGRFVPVCFAPGFLRGVCFHGDFAILCLSTYDSTRTAGILLDDRLAKAGERAFCGLQVISLSQGKVIHSVAFEGTVSEIFDVLVLDKVRNPAGIQNRYKDLQRTITFEGAEPKARPSWAGSGAR